MHAPANYQREIHASADYQREIHASANYQSEVQSPANYQREVHAPANYQREVHTSLQQRFEEPTFEYIGPAIQSRVSSYIGEENLPPRGYETPSPVNLTMEGYQG